MRPKENIVVVGIRPELRFILRIEMPVWVWPVESIPELRKHLAEVDIRLAIVDYRDAPTLARKTIWRLRQMPYRPVIVLIAANEELRRAPRYDVIVRDGVEFYQRLFNVVKIGLARRRGPRPGIEVHGSINKTVQRELLALPKSRASVSGANRNR